MDRTVVDLDEASLALAQRQPGTKTRRDTFEALEEYERSGR